MKSIFLIVLALCSLTFASFNGGTKKYAYTLDEVNSVVIWSGSSPKKSHHGTFAVTSRGIDIAEGKLIGGSFTIPIASIKNTDLSKAMKPVLIKHLKSKDFFHMAMYPEASFNITEVQPLLLKMEKAVEGANTLVIGDFTMLGTTHAISFPAKIELKDNTFAVEATLQIDRTKWGMTYAADPSMGNRHIHPQVDIHLKLFGLKN